MADLVGGPAWRKSSYSSGSGNACVEVAAWRTSSHSGSSDDACVEVADTARVVLVRDTTDRTGPVLRVSAETWRRFTATLRWATPTLGRGDPDDLHRDLVRAQHAGGLGQGDLGEREQRVWRQRITLPQQDGVHDLSRRECRIQRPAVRQPGNGLHELLTSIRT